MYDTETGQQIYELQGNRFFPRSVDFSQDGRYLLLGRSRDLTGLHPLEAVHALGMPEVRTRDGLPVQEGLVLADKLRPARRQGRPVLYVEWSGEHWLPLKEE